ncbi:hypothetical protein [Clostridium magnum]|uniref:Uncharacterized protein n=1 Tax=Clostridium magnum DSM 2767 TaxID=1121326 RepID=A0A161W206_9CLOT|nr:hypothetical protein [Clostridium magnum]KZL89210.1 hypothetical protein CLMAG_54280 [Clostridium magnum DSM 2767]SHJ35771.1 hypothetical protein SAMN02745944_05827 [Clostridium magnum DSM 2767]
MSYLKNIFSVSNEETGDINSVFLMEDHKFLVEEVKDGKRNCSIYSSLENYIKSLTIHRWIVQKIDKEQLKNLKKIIKTHEPFVFNSSFMKNGMVYVDILYNFDKFEIEYDYEFNEYSIVGGFKLNDGLMKILIHLSQIEISNKTRYYYCKRCGDKFVSKKFVDDTKCILCPNKCGNNGLIDISNEEERDSYLKREFKLEVC